VRVPGRAEGRRVELAVRRSISEIAGARVRIGGGQLADLVAAEKALDAAGQTAAFQLAAVYGNDTLAPSVANHLYVRIANTGNVALTGARVRVFRLDVSATPISRSDVGQQAINVAVGATGTADITFDPGAVPGGTRVFLLVVADHPLRPFDPPATFASFTEVDALCIARANVAYRDLKVR